MAEKLDEKCTECDGSGLDYGPTKCWTCKGTGHEMTDAGKSLAEFLERQGFKRMRDW